VTQRATVVSLEVPLPEPSPASPAPVPWFQTGGVIPVTVTAVARDALRGAVLQLVLRCHGSGTPEGRVVTQQPLSGEAVERVDLAIPAGEPASYCGEHVKLDWLIAVEAAGKRLAELPIWVRPRRPGH
jgi:hypothetical protein